MITATYWERDNEISRINAAGQVPVSLFLSDIKAWYIAAEGEGMQAIAREQDVVRWERDRGIFEKYSPEKQHEKTLEEVQELTDALASGDRAETMDAIGDIIVTLILQAQMHDWTAGQCLESAYQVIRHRKGEMRDGLFVKES